MPFFPIISLFKIFICLDDNRAISNSYATSVLVAHLIIFFLILFPPFFTPVQAHHALSTAVDFKHKLLGTGTPIFF